MDEMRLDGNAIGGMLGEIFVHEMTSARVECGSCGRVEPVGAEHVYMQAPSVVMRCCHCDGVLLVMTKADQRTIVGIEGSRRLEFVATR
jgi:hypothetical protein